HINIIYENSLTPALVRPTMAAVPPSLRMKAFLPFPLDTTSAVRLLPGFSAMDPVQKAILHHTLGLPPATKRKHASCGVCQMRFNSQSQALAHLKGTKHAKKLKALDAPKSKLKGSGVTEDSTNLEITKSISSSQLTDSPEGADSSGSAPFILSLLPKEVQPSASSMTSSTPAPLASPLTTSAPRSEPSTETEEEKARRLLYCSLCKVAVNSASQLEAHNSGKRHVRSTRPMLGARTGVGSIKSFPRTGVKSKLAPSTKSSGLQNKTFYCETCACTSTQTLTHQQAGDTKDRAAGKRPNKNTAPYNQAKRWVKELQCQPLPAQILPAHLAANGGGRRMSGSVAAPHRPRHRGPAPSPALFQTQTLSAALLRPAPGAPSRTSHPQVLFSPILTSLTQ
uniref:Zinc finger protein 385D n=1 Tax=Takifugu rubripes TaxID=31033 RepID=H2TII0_TAKRU